MSKLALVLAWLLLMVSTASIVYGLLPEPEEPVKLEDPTGEETDVIVADMDEDPIIFTFTEDDPQAELTITSSGWDDSLIGSEITFSSDGEDLIKLSDGYFHYKRWKIVDIYQMRNRFNEWLTQAESGNCVCE